MPNTNATTTDTTTAAETLTEWLDADRDMPTNATLTLKRSGEFVLRVKGDRHCGVYPEGGPREVPCEYSLTLKCRGDSLDGEGFLVEQIGIHRFFQNLPRTGLSCEKLCVRCARLIYRKVMRENPNCKVLGITLSISPRPRHLPNGGAAGMTFEWDLLADPPRRDRRLN